MENLSLKVPVLHRTAPFIFLKMNKYNKNYRLSANYKYLNSKYDLKMNFIRDLDKIHYPDNKFFTIKENVIYLKKNNNIQEWLLKESEDNTLYISKIIYDDTSIMVLKRIFQDDINYSIFFGSLSYYNLNHFLEESL